MTRDEIITKVQNLINQAYKYDIDSKYYEGLFDEVEKLKQPITFAEFLGWEEGQEYELGIYDGGVHRIKDGRLEQSIGNGEWCNARLNLTPVQIRKLRQAKKVEPKYYAKIKGWELLGYECDKFWNYNMRVNALFLSDTEEGINIKTIFTKTVWNELGIDDTNADFEEVE